MVAQDAVEKKRKSKKKRSRTEVSSSSESDSEREQKKNEKVNVVVEKEASPVTDITPNSAKKSKKPKAVLEATAELSIKDAEPAISPKAPVTKGNSKSTAQPQEDFGAIYLRKITAELADDLDKVREAQDFKANSVPMLIHALKQGERLFTVEEKGRVVGAAGQ